MATRTRTMLLAALVLSTAAPASFYATRSFASITNISLTDEYLRELCERREFKRSELTRIQKSKYYPDLLEYTLDHCPGVAAALTNGATASVLPAADDGTGGTGTGGTGTGDDGTDGGDTGTGGGDTGGGTGGGDTGGGTGGGDTGGGTGGTGNNGNGNGNGNGNNGNGNNGLGNGDEGNCQGRGCTDAGNPGHQGG